MEGLPDNGSRLPVTWSWEGRERQTKNSSLSGLTVEVNKMRQAESFVERVTKSSLSLFSLVILASRFEAIRRLFWEGPRSFEPRSDDEDDTMGSIMVPPGGVEDVTFSAR
ncbi:hypothetical protein AVEN_266377-1 [Araneus ventricosus]|uniref:Uncharacterized protein n=1 Tax=Araneus ventricosus TaxID=182803 RepID=A0A4Y2CPS7_ARAVE|nr:hypothetical protein AVEN_266377-1 [Araneus ventricosus]